MELAYANFKTIGSMHLVKKCCLISVVHVSLSASVSLFVYAIIDKYTRKNTPVVTSLQTSCNKSVHKLSTSCVRTVCS